MRYLTYVDAARPRWFCVMVATGPNTRPTPDGGPWAVQYEVPSRSRLAECSQTAEYLLQRRLRDDAPAVFRDGVALGWFGEKGGDDDLCTDEPCPACRSGIIPDRSAEAVWRCTCDAAPSEPYTPCTDPYPDCGVCRGSGTVDGIPCDTCVWRRWFAENCDE